MQTPQTEPRPIYHPSDAKLSSQKSLLLQWGLQYTSWQLALHLRATRHPCRASCQLACCRPHKQNRVRCINNRTRNYAVKRACSYNGVCNTQVGNLRYICEPPVTHVERVANSLAADPTNKTASDVLTIGRETQQSKEPALTMGSATHKLATCATFAHDPIPM